MTIFSRIEGFQELSSALLPVIAAKDLSATSELLELKYENSSLLVTTAGTDYHIKSTVEANSSDNDSTFCVVVNADKFLKLIQKMTAKALELYVEGQSLCIKCNGLYKLPIVYNGDSMAAVPLAPSIDDTIASFDISYSTLDSISKYNSKELAKAAVIINPIQKLYYVDKLGCLTFTTGACINNFNLSADIKFFMSARTVAMLKLLKSATAAFTIGTNSVNGVIVYTFKANCIELTCIQPAGDVNDFPSAKIRSLADSSQFCYTANVKRLDLLGAISRLEIINELQPIALKFKTDGTLEISSKIGGVEEIHFEFSSEPYEYELFVDINDIKLSIDKFIDEDISMLFGNSTALVVSQSNIQYVIPEVY